MKYVILVLSFSFLTSLSYGQYRWEIGAKAGVGNYLGDIGGYEKERRDGPVDMRFEQTNWTLGVYTRYKISPLITIKGEFNAARFRGSDHLSDNIERSARNLSFRNMVLELGVRPEITIFRDNDVAGRGYYNPQFRLYAFIGITGIYHNPQGSMDGANWVNLKDFKTEGQNQAYSNFTLAIPAGLGLYFTHKKAHRFGWEIGWRTTFTDYLDDVSDRYGDPSEMSEEAAAYSNRSSLELIHNLNAQAASNGQDPVGPESFEISSTTGENIHGQVKNDQGVYGGQKRGDPTRNDSYILTQFSYGYLIKGKSNYYRKKYSWIKKKRSVGRKTRAKF